jgi:glycosyltransferase involved in cell wall biosynthesis
MSSALRERGSVGLLWLIDSLALGGAERLVAPFAREAAARGLRLHVCSLKTIDGNPLEPAVRATGVGFTNLEARHLRDRRAFAALVRLVRERRIALIHAHLTSAGIWGALAARLTGVACVASLHTLPVEGRLRDRAVMRHRLMCLLLDRWSRAVVAVSSALAAAYAGRISPARLVVVRNGIDCERFARPACDRGALRRAFGWPAEAPVVITVAALREAKGIHVLLAAAARVIRRVPGARFLIVGAGPLASELAREAERAGLGRAVAWAGRRDDVAELLAASDLFVLPSLSDAYPTAVLEATAAGLPVVASAADGIPEIVEPGVTGLLVAPGDADGLAREIARLLERPDLRASMGRAGRARAARDFTVGRWVDRLEAVYARALEGADMRGWSL